jgi:hypothetical protein
MFPPSKFFRASSQRVRRIEFGWSDLNHGKHRKHKHPRPSRRHTDGQRINPEPDSKERGEKIADEIAHRGAREHEYDDQQKPFNK